MTDICRPLLRWAGSKRRLLPVLRASAPKEFERYIEPFCGSICLFVDLKPKKAVLSDNNPELIHFYRTLRHRPAHIGKLAAAMPLTESFYYELRALNPVTLSSNDRAARFLYLNRFCFNGVYRTNKQGQFNVPRGKHMGALPSVEEITNFGRFIRSAEFHAADFEELLDIATTGDFVYLDPPYAGASRDRGEYGINAFKEIDIVRLTDACNRASKRGAKVLLSYADLPIMRALLPNWGVRELDVLRSVSGFSRGRGMVQEILISNFN
jgi:DNA adenine methylase